MTAAAAHRARALTGALARAESLAQLCRDHGHPARVVVGRKRGTVRIKTADVETYRGRGHWVVYMLPADRAAVWEWLGY